MWPIFCAHSWLHCIPAVAGVTPGASIPTIAGISAVAGVAAVLIFLSLPKFLLLLCLGCCLYLCCYLSWRICGYRLPLLSGVSAVVGIFTFVVSVPAVTGFPSSSSVSALVGDSTVAGVPAVTGFPSSSFISAVADDSTVAGVPAVTTLSLRCYYAVTLL